MNICLENGHDWETVGTIDTVPYDGKVYTLVLSECLNCGEERTWRGHEIKEDDL